MGNNGAHWDDHARGVAIGQVAGAMRNRYAALVDARAEFVRCASLYQEARDTYVKTMGAHETVIAAVTGPGDAMVLEAAALDTTDRLRSKAKT